MKRLAALLMGCLVCAGGLAAAAGGAEDAAAKAASAQAMYQVEELVGTLVATLKMYSSEGAMWYKGELRVDEAPGEKSAHKPGDVLPIRYQVGRPTRRGSAGLGDQIRVKLGREQGGEEEWVAQG